MVTWRRCALFAFAAFVLGGVVASATLRSPAREEHKEKAVQKLDDHQAQSLDQSWAWNYNATTPPKEIVRVKRIYVPSPDGGCAVASEETTTERSGTGSIVISSDQKLKAEASRDLTLFNSREVLTIKEEAPRWAAAVLAGVNQKLELQMQANASYRFWGPFTINGAVNKSASDWSASVGPGVVF